MSLIHTNNNVLNLFRFTRAILRTRDCSRPLHSSGELSSLSVSYYGISTLRRKIFTEVWRCVWHFPKRLRGEKCSVYFSVWVGNQDGSFQSYVLLFGPRVERATECHPAGRINNNLFYLWHLNEKNCVFRPLARSASVTTSWWWRRRWNKDTSRSWPSRTTMCSTRYR